MDFNKFFYTFRDVNGVQLSEDVFLFRKPLEVWNAKTDKTVKFDNLKEVWKYEYSPGVTVGDTLSKMENFAFELSGGHGKGSGSGGTFKFGHAGGGGGVQLGEIEPLQPVQANVRIKSKSPEAALKEFRQNHVLLDAEYMYEVDDRGFVRQYAAGNATSVAPVKAVQKNSMIYHNHPGKTGGAFSDNDLFFVAQTRASGIVASGREGDYIFKKKGGHGKSSGFGTAIRKQKDIIASLDREIAEIKAFAKKESQSGKLPSFYGRDTPELRKDYERLLLKTNKLQSKIAQRTHAKKQLLRIEKIKNSLSGK